MKNTLGIAHYLKTPTYFVACLLATSLLTSCGSGSSQPDQEAAVGQALTDVETLSPQLQEASLRLDEAWGEYGAFYDEAEAASDAYTGSVEAAVVETSTIGGALTSAMMGIPYGTVDAHAYNQYRFGSKLGIIADLIELPYIYMALSTSEHLNEQSSSCPAGGNIKLYAAKNKLDPTANQADPYEWQRASLVVELDQCAIEAGTLDGVINITIDKTPGNEPSTTYAMEGLEAWFSDVRVLATGVISKTENCVSSPTMRADLVLSVYGSDEQTLYDNFEWKTHDEAGDLCMNYKGYPWNQFSGSLYLSDVGMYQVSTQGVFPFQRDSTFAHIVLGRDNIDDESVLQEYEGVVALDGAADGRMELTHIVSLVTDDDSRAEWPHVQATITPSGSEPAVTYSASSGAMKSGIWHDLGDADFDGLPNSWEAFHGLDLDNPHDAQEEQRFFQLTQLEVYENNLNPLNNTSHAPSTDVGITVDIEEKVDVDSGRMSLAALVSGYSLEKRYQPLLKRFDATVLGIADWDYELIPKLCAATNTPKTIRCQYSFDSANATGSQFSAMRLPILTNQDGEVEVAVALDERALDTDLSNNTDSDATTYYITPPVDFGIDVATHAVGNTEDIKTITATITQPRAAGKSDLETTAMTSPGISIVEAELVSSGSQALISRCVIGATIVCNINDVLPGEELQFELSYRLNEQSDQTINWAISSDSEDISEQNNSQTTDVSAVMSTTSLQSLIDGAEEGAIVELPSGRYVGTLNLLRKNISLRGASGAEPTVLESYAQDEPIFKSGPKYFLIQNMTLRTSGGLIAERFDENLTISDSIIEPTLDVSHAVDGLFYSGSYRILRSTIRGFGVGEANTCGSLFHQPMVRTGYGVSVYLEQNLIVDNNCDQMILSDTSDYITHYLNNNTLINNPTLFRMTSSSADNALSFINNIIVGTDVLLDLPSSAYLGQYSAFRGLFSSRNLIWQSERSSLLTTDMLNRAGIELDKLDFNMDPKFVDPENMDYRLKSDSPIIDRGTDPAAYVWTFSDGAYENYAPSEDDKIKALDGLSNGNVVFDLGAFEYDPTNQ